MQAVGRGMIILAHRGWWSAPAERNSRQALRRAFERGYGVETDVRDQDGRLVISHDPPTGSDLMEFSEFLDLHESHGSPGVLAINIKADGLQDALLAQLRARPKAAYFTFDMAVPDAVGYLRRGAVTYTRQSEYEPVPSFYEQAHGVWLDAFDSDWFGADVVETHLAAGKRVALVSPELHGRGHEAAWATWRGLTQTIPEGILALCTDFPDQAHRFFHG